MTGPYGLASYNANSYTGGTFLNSGRLYITQDSSLGAAGSPVTFNGGELGAGQAFTINRDITLGPAGGTIDAGLGQGSFLTISSTIHGSGTLTVLNANLKLTGTNTYSGGTFVNGSNLIGTTDSLQGNISLSGVTSATLEFAQSFNGTYAGNISGGGGNVFLRGPGVVSFTGNNTYTADTSLYAGALEVSATGGGLSPSSRLIFELNGPQTSGGPVLQIVGGGSFTRPLSQVLWNGPGGFAARDGTLAVNIGGNSGQFSLDPTANPTRYKLVFGSPTANSVTDFQNPIYLGASANTSPAPTVEVDAGAGGDYTVLSGVISGGNSLTKTGNGRLVLSAANIYTGPTNVAGGILSVSTLANGGTVSNIGQSINAATNLTFANGGVLQYSGPTVSTDRSFTLAVTGGGFEVTQAATALTLSGVGTGAGGFLKTGAGTLTLTGANTYTGGTTINAGTLQIGGADNRLPTTGNVTFTGGTLDLNGFSQTVNGLASVGGAGVVTSGAAGAVTLTVGNGGGGGSYSGVIQDGGGTVALAKVGAGTQTLTGANTYTGGTSLNGGALALGSAGAIGATGTISFGGGALQFSAANTTDYSPRFSTANNQAYRLDTNGQAVTLASALTSSGGSLTKLGAGTLTLTGANTYTGPTLVNGGTLRLSGTGSFAASRTVTVSSGATLDVAGVTGGANFSAATASFALAANQTLAGVGGGATPAVTGTLAVAANSTVAPGTAAAIGTLTVGAGTMTWLPGGRYTVKYDGGSATSDLIAATTTGTAALSLANLTANSFTLNLQPTTFPAAPTQQTYTIATFPDGVTLPGGQDPNNLNNLFTFTGRFDTTAPIMAFVSGTSVRLTFTPVPEPAHALLLCAAAAGAAGWRRRRRDRLPVPHGPDLRPVLQPALRQTGRDPDGPLARPVRAVAGVDARVGVEDQLDHGAGVGLEFADDQPVVSGRLAPVDAAGRVAAAHGRHRPDGERARPDQQRRGDRQRPPALPEPEGEPRGQPRGRQRIYAAAGGN
jgi:autotransporter-associated beta strand protein